MSQVINATEEHGHDDHGHKETFISKYIWSLDHKMIAKQYIFTSLLFFILGGLLAMAVRWKIGFPNVPVPVLGWLFSNSYMFDADGILLPSAYNMLFTMHATVMVFLVIMPLLIGGFGNYLIPLQIGARDMAFPFFNALSYWVYVVSGVIMLSSFFVPGGAANTGWTAYAPLSSNAQFSGVGLGQTLWATGIFINGLASIMGAFNYITTVISMRAPGMTAWRIPLSTWALTITAVLLLLAVPVLSAAGVMLIFDINLGTSFFNPQTGGQPLLWQHLFWFFGHPEVYIIILPAMGLVSDVMTTHCRKPIFGYKAMVLALWAIAIVGFIVWGHHMFVSGMSVVLGSAFMLSTVVIAVPSAIKTFNWLGTLWGGSIHYTSPMLNALAFLAMFVIGGLSGIFLASTPVDMFVHHTYFVVAHFHYVMVGGSFFGFFAAIYHWYPKIFGRMMSEPLAKVHTFLNFLFFNCTFLPMHNLGLGGMMRRIADPTMYEHLRNLQPINQFVSISAFCMGLTQLIFVYNFFKSMKSGEPAPKNPWKSNTLEWTVPSPPKHGNFGEKVPTVYHAPYEYSLPGYKDDYLPQDQPLENGESAEEYAKKHGYISTH